MARLEALFSDHLWIVITGVGTIVLVLVGTAPLLKAGRGWHNKTAIAALSIREKNGQVRIFPVSLGKTYNIGRAGDNLIRMDDSDKTVSRYHVKVTVRKEYIEVVDQGSTNKIRLSENGTEEATARVSLHNSFWLGNAQLTVIP
jgi:hypothetical protein